MPYPSTKPRASLRLRSLRFAASLAGERLVLGLGWLLIVVLTSAACLFLWRTRVDTLDEWQHYLSNFSTMTGAHALQSMKAVDLVLERIVDQVAGLGVETEADLRRTMGTREAYVMLRGNAHHVPQIAAASVVALNGDYINFTREYPTPPLNVSDREYFKEHLANPVVEVSISAPVRNRATGEWTFFLLRTIRARSGRQIGVAMAGINCAYFEDFYRTTLPGGLGSSIALFRRDGMMLARYPGDGSLPGKAYKGSTAYAMMANGRERTTEVVTSSRLSDPLDSSMRIIAVNTVAEYPLYVTVVSPGSLVLARWQATSWFVGISTLILDLVIGTLTLWIYRLLRRERATIDTLRAAKVAADAGNEAKSGFLAMMSHEIRTPMNGVLGMLEILSLTKLDMDQRVSLSVMRDSGDCLMRIIDDILDFTKIEAGKLELQPEPASVAKMMDRLCNMYSGSASSKGLLLRCHVDPAISPILSVDPLRLQQILNNFVSNAIKFTNKGEITIRAELAGRRDGGEVVRFTVRDTGIGVSPEEMSNLFEPFTQAAAGSDRRHGGTGLGLSICRRLATMMSGNVEMFSTPGTGTTMVLTVALPIPEPSTVALFAPHASTIVADVVAERRQAPAVLQAEEEKTLILLVDDHPVNRMVMARQVSILGYATESAEDGFAALDLWSTGRFGLLITDCNMPEMDGYELARRIREVEARTGLPRTPIIACTANAMGGEAEKCRAAGMDDYITKPTQIPQLAEKLDQWLPLAPKVREAASHPR
jgi:signal transduction histidine kinase/ActR/RegA family two-component response regulator